MSQPSPAKTNEEKVSAETKTEKHTIVTETKTASSLQQDSKTNNLATAIDQEKCRSLVDLIHLPLLSSPSSLYWHIAKKKSKQFLYPVRLPPDPSEYIGYAQVLTVSDPAKKVVVQYVQFPHVEISSRDIGLYAVVPRSQLVPYHGSDSNKEQWCPILSQKYFHQLKRQHKQVGDEQIRIEELYLERVLQKAVEEEESKAQLEQYDIAIEEPEEEELTTRESTTAPVDSDVESVETTGNLRRSKRHRRNEDPKNTDWLHIGDVIQLYKPSTTAGHPENLRMATIRAIHPQSEYILTVDCPDEFHLVIPNEHPIKRIKRMERGKLVICTGTKYWPVDSFTMKREGEKDAAQKMVRERVCEMKKSLEEKKRLLVEQIEEDGCGPVDLLR